MRCLHDFRKRLIWKSVVGLRLKRRCGSMRFLVVSALLLACVAPASANCPNHCSGRGDCNSADLRCKCHQSIEQQDVWYAGGDCSLRTSFVRRRVVGGCWYVALREMGWGGRADAASSGRAHGSGAKLWRRLCPCSCCFVVVLFRLAPFTAAVCGLPLTHRGVAHAGTC
jgi:hypothetical protein